MNEVFREFLLETHESLAQLDLDLVTLEKEPKESETLARAFRTLHTVKGTAGFLGFAKLQAVGHASESLLSRLRGGELVFNADIATTLLGVVDAIRQMLTSIEQTEGEGDGDYSALIHDLDRLKNTGSLESSTRVGDPPRIMASSNMAALADGGGIGPTLPTAARSARLRAPVLAPTLAPTADSGGGGSPTPAAAPAPRAP